MVGVVEVVIYICLGIGVFFNGLGSFGLIRFPDVYTRLHTATKTTTFGSIFLILAVVFYGFAGWSGGEGASNGVLCLHAIAALIALLITNPTGAHAIARAAYRSGVKPWGIVIDQLEIARTGGSASKAEGTDTGKEEKVTGFSGGGEGHA